MANKQLMLPANRAFNSNGLSVRGAKAYLYAAGTTTPANFYADSDLTTSLGPVLTANGAGRFATPAYQDESVAFRFIVKDAAGAQLDDIDPFHFGLTVGVDGAVGSTGAQGPEGEIVGELSAANYDPTADGSTDDKTALSNADTAAAAVTKRTALPAGTYAVASDLTFTRQVRFADGAKLKPADGVTIHFNEGYVADDWNQCFDISAGGIVTGDKAPMGYVTPQHFGADPTDTAVDDMPAIEAATEFATLAPIRTEYAMGLPVKFPNPGDGNYYLTKTRPIYIARTTHWFTDAVRYGSTSGGTEIRGADGLDAVAFCFFPGANSAPAEYEPSNAPTDPTPGIGKSYGGLRSRFEDLNFLPESGATVRQGFVANAVVFLDRCAGSGFTEAGCHLHAQTSGCIINAFAAPGVTNDGDTSISVPASTVAYDGEGCVWGNVNGSRLTDCDFHNGVAAAGVNGGSYGIVMHGNNAGTVRLINPYCNGNQGAGILENTSIGCTILGSSTAQNCWKVSNGGAFYICIKYHIADAASEPGVGASWQTYWALSTATTADSAWALGEAYHPCGGINVCDINSRTTILDGYTEGGIEVGVIVRTMCEVRGGNACERAPWHAEYGGARVSTVAGSSASPIGYTGQTTPGVADTNYGIALGAVNAFTGGRIFQFGDGRDNVTTPTSRMRFAWNNIRKWYGLTNADDFNSTLLAYPGTSFGGLGGRTGSAAGLIAPMGVIVGNRSTTFSSSARIMAAANLAGITGAVVQGDVWLYASPTVGGPIGARCTTSGTVGTDAVIEELYASPKKVSSQSGTSYTAVLADAQNYIRFTNGSAVTFTIPPNSSVAFAIGTLIEVEQAGAGALSIAAGSGVTVNSRGTDLTLAGQYGVAALKKVATDTWTLTGDL